jgi:hypothetical protein
MGKHQIAWEMGGMEADNKEPLWYKMGADEKVTHCADLDCLPEAIHGIPVIETFSLLVG